MAHSQLDDESRDAPDDHWIFEELGSPVKPRKRKLSTIQCSSSKNIMEKNEFDEKLRIYSNNMRKLIITARKEINTLKQENITLQRKLESSGLVECPACLFRFKPEKEHKILPKYIKVFRGRLCLEVEFSTLDEMDHWLVANQLDLNSDGLPTMIKASEKEKYDLADSGSLIPKLVKEQQANVKRERVVISTRLRDKDAVISGSDHSTEISSSKVPDTPGSNHSETKSDFEEVGVDHASRNSTPSTSFSNGTLESTQYRKSDDYRTSENNSSDNSESSPKAIMKEEDRYHRKCGSENRDRDTRNRGTKGGKLDRSGRDVSTRLREGTYHETHSKILVEKIRCAGDQRSDRDRERHPRSPVKILNRRSPESRHCHRSSKEVRGKENAHECGNEFCTGRGSDHKCSRSYPEKEDRKSEKSSKKSTHVSSLVDRLNLDHRRERRNEEDIHSKARNGRAKESSHSSLERRHSGESQRGSERSSTRRSLHRAHRDRDRNTRHSLRKSFEKIENGDPEREKRRYSRSRDSSRKRGEVEDLRQHSPPIKRRRSLSRNEELRRGASPNIQEQNWQDLAEGGVEEMTADEDESIISDIDLIIVDEEEVEDGEILE